MKRVLLGLVVCILSFGAYLSAVDKTWTWTGVISCSHCGPVHNPGHMGDNVDSRNITARECVIGKTDGSVPGCVSMKNHGKLVFVTGGKVYQISNQDFADIRTHADHAVALIGIMTGDTIAVSAIRLATKKDLKQRD